MFGPKSTPIQWIKKHHLNRTTELHCVFFQISKSMFSVCYVGSIQHEWPNCKRTEVVKPKNLLHICHSLILLVFWCLHSLMNIDFHGYCAVCHQTVHKSHKFTCIQNEISATKASVTIARCQCDTRSTFSGIYFSSPSHAYGSLAESGELGKVEKCVAFYLFFVLLVILSAFVVISSMLIKYIGLVWLTQ